MARLDARAMQCALQNVASGSSPTAGLRARVASATSNQDAPNIDAALQRAESALASLAAVVLTLIFNAIGGINTASRASDVRATTKRRMSMMIAAHAAVAHPSSTLTSNHAE